MVTKSPSSSAAAIADMFHLISDFRKIKQAGSACQGVRQVCLRSLDARCFVTQCAKFTELIRPEGSVAVGVGVLRLPSTRRYETILECFARLACQAINVRHAIIQKAESTSEVAVRNVRDV